MRTREPWDRKEKISAAAAFVTAIVAIAAIAFGALNASRLQSRLISSDHAALVSQGKNIALAFLARVEDESHGVLRMVTGKGSASHSTFSCRT